MFNTSIKFKNLIQDRENGSTTIAIKFIEILLSFLNSSSMDDIDLNLTLKKLNNEFKDMSIINCIIIEIQNNRDNLINTCHKILEDIYSTDTRILTEFKSHIESTNKSFLTFSNSHSIKFVLCNSNPGSVYVMESIPGGEGKILYNDFKECLKEISLSFIEDDKLELNKDNHFDYIIIGCDAFNKEKGIVNKIGTTKLIKKAKENNIPVIVIASKFKSMNENDFLNKTKKLKSNLLEFVPLMENMVIISA